MDAEPQEVVGAPRQACHCPRTPPMKRKLSRPLPDLSSIIALTGSDEDLDNVRRHKRYLSEAMAHDMKRLTMSMDVTKGPPHTPSSSARSDTEDAGSGMNTPMDCCTPSSDTSQLPGYPCPSPPQGWRVGEGLQPGLSQHMDVGSTAHTPHRLLKPSDSLASAVDRHDGLCLGSPSDHSTTDLRKTALMRSMFRRNEHCHRAGRGVEPPEHAPRHLKTRLELPYVSPSHSLGTARHARRAPLEGSCLDQPCCP